MLFLRVLNMGPTGYLLAIICADGLSALFLFAVTKTWRFLDFKRFDTKLLKKMLRYALPLVPASIFWWITNASDQFFVAAMLEDGTSWTAVLGASYKLPTILSIVSTIFTEAWQISAFTDGTDSPVSYTHLDVYKRQGVACIAGNLVTIGLQQLCQFSKRLRLAERLAAGKGDAAHQRIFLHTPEQVLHCHIRARAERPAFRVVAALAPARAALRKNSCAQARAVYNGILHDACDIDRLLYQNKSAP